MPNERASLSTWWYAIRPHTLGASIAPMLVVLGALIADDKMSVVPYLLCLIVALSAQIASNMANDYFDYRKGIDTQERIGFERLLTSGKMSSQQMFLGLIVVVFICMLAGCLLILTKGIALLWVGLAVLITLFAYSAGPYPLSHHGLGDVAVVLFFGIVPVLGTYYAVAERPPLYLLALALGIGLWEANILVVNNYRDHDEDKAQGKSTLIVRMGRPAGPKLYHINALVAFAAIALGLIAQEGGGAMTYITLFISALPMAFGSWGITQVKGRGLNKLLAYTSKSAMVIAFFIALALIL